MDNNVMMAVIEACGEKIVGQKAFNDRCMEHIEHLVATNEKMHRELGELKGRDNEGIRAECEAIANAEATEDIGETAYCKGDCDTCEPCRECDEDCGECEKSGD